MSELNSLVIGESPLYLLLAAGNNDAGQIVGFGVDADGNLRAFLATPREPRGMVRTNGRNSTSPSTRGA